MANLTESDWEEIIRDAGFRRIKARDYKGNFKKAFDSFENKKKKKIKPKIIIESKDITEPLSPYKINKTA